MTTFDIQTGHTRHDVMYYNTPSVTFVSSVDSSAFDYAVFDSIVSRNRSAVNTGQWFFVGLLIFFFPGRDNRRKRIPPKTRGGATTTTTSTYDKRVRRSRANR